MENSQFSLSHVDEKMSNNLIFLKQVSLHSTVVTCHPSGLSLVDLVLNRYTTDHDPGQPKTTSTAFISPSIQ